MHKSEVESMAESLKLMGPGAPVLEEGKVQLEQAAWVIEKARGGWAVRFAPVAATSFDLILKPESGPEPRKATEAIALVRTCLAEAEIVSDRPETVVVSAPITIKIDNEPHEAQENPMSANAILRLGGLDPDSNYLVQIKVGERIKCEGTGKQLIDLYMGAEFVGHYTGPKGVSQPEG